MSSPNPHVDRDLDLSNAGRGVWLVKEPGEENIPRDHRLDVSGITHQTLGVFSHVAPSDVNAVVPETEKLSMEGKIVQKLECRPYADNCYMKLKLESIRKASQPVRQVQQLDRIVQNFKPVSDHKHNIEYEEKKKAEGKKARDDKDSVYLKEILKEVCNYNLKNPHKNMWELKPEYRHYKDPVPAPASTDD
ncbi:General transcription factor IIF subunit 2 [Blattella germanica]|nr:General transcription factor IIF subunit 2 [Blattella germanica]